MLSRFAIVLILCVASVVPAYAGQISTTNGKTVWTSTQCKEPTAPAGLPKNPETPANDMNARITAYNNFANAADVYMKCLVTESTHDAATGGNEITQQAQAMIDAEQSKAVALHTSLNNPSK